MINLIKMDLYRILRSRVFKIAIIMSFVVSFVAMLFGYGILELFKFALVHDESAAMGFTLFPMANWYYGVDLAELVVFGSNCLSLFIGCMVTASFIGSEQSCGYIKNIAGQLPNRGYTAISKFVATSISQLIIFVIYIAVSIGCSFAFFSKYIEAYSIGEMIAVLGLKLLLYFAVNAVILFLCTLTKSQSLAMVTGAVLGSGVTWLIYFAINSILGIVKININISDYMPDGINGALSISNFSSLAPKALLVSAIFIVGFLFITVVLLKKRDVK